jgi:major type 1 subunit fimbrin (pilin)
MNKTLLSAALIAGFGVAAFAPPAARAAATDSGTITIQGKVLSSTCSVNVNDSGSTSGTVTLPDVAMSALNANGTGAYAPSATPFTLALTGCPTTPAGVKVGAQFYSTNADTTTGNGTLQNSTGSAAGVEVQLLDGSNAPVTINNSASAYALTDNSNVTDQTALSSGSATLDYTAQYYVTNLTTLAAGTVTTTVNYQINYQ